MQIYSLKDMVPTIRKLDKYSNLKFEEKYKDLIKKRNLHRKKSLDIFGRFPRFISNHIKLILN